MRGLVVFAALAACVGIIYGQSFSFTFVFDDVGFILSQPDVSKGLTSEALLWALTSQDFCNWFPLTRLAVIADSALFDLAPGPMHLVNASIHLAAAWMAFRALAAATGNVWPSAFAAALFAAHPLQVEAVAWLSERSMLLAALCFWTTLEAYVHYVRKPDAGRYLLVFLCLLLGLLSKPIIVTLPAILLLLDWWPLGRGRLPSGTVETWRSRSTWSFLVVEKVPLFMISAAFGTAALRAQVACGSMAALQHLPPAARLVTAVRGIAWYLEKIFWPAELGVYYPLTQPLADWRPAAAAAALLGGVSVLVVAYRRRAPHLFVGWLWFILILVPVSGILQAGAQATADRYAFLPLAGVLIAASWSLTSAAKRFGSSRLAVVTCALAVVASVAVAHRQTRFWLDDLTLFQRALAVGGTESPLIHDRLATANIDAGRYATALQHCRESLKLRPRSTSGENNLGLALLHLGNTAVAIAHFRAATELGPRNVHAFRNLGEALARQQRTADAVRAYAAAIRAGTPEPQDFEHLGKLLADQGRSAAAAACFEEARRVGPARIP